MASPQRALARELADLDRRIVAVERGGQLARSSVTVDGQPVGVPAGIAAGVHAEVAAAEALDAAATAQAKADGAVTAYYGDDADLTGARTGDFWRKDNGDVFTLDSAGVWQPVSSPDVRAAMDAAAQAQSTADGKVTTFYENDADTPTAEGVGDVWVVKDLDHRLRRWDGTTWVDVRDLGIEAAQQTADDALFDANNITGAQILDGEVSSAKIAQAYTDTLNLSAQEKADLAEAQAIAAAATDAQTKADAAEAAAVDTAAADATAKANAAETDAINYTDAQKSAWLDSAALTAQEKADLAEAQAISAAATDATTKADAAEADAIAAAQTKADAARDAAIATAADDATAKANAAESDAVTTAAADAQAKADAARDAAVSTAATDATQKADAAEADAVAAAATDATTKANAAEAAAVDTAAADATQKADAAEAAAVSTAATDATTKADAARQDAIAAAATDATTKANAAEADAKAYTDAEKSAWLDSAALTAQEKADLAEAEAIAEAEAVEGRALSRGTDLVTNGTGYLGNNYNFTDFTFDPTDAPIGAAGSFTIEGNTYGIWADELIPVSGSKKYRYSFAVRQQVEGIQSRFYGAIRPVDGAGNGISPPHYMYEAGTTTTLAQPLNVGDTEVHLTGGGANFYGSPDKPAGASDHKRRIIWWDYTDPFGKTWAPETYSRNTTGSDTWADGAVVGNVITLRAPYDGPPKPAGTYLSNGSAGGSYIYTAANQIAPQVWTSYGESIDGAMAQGEPNSGRGVARMVTGLPPGTASIRVGWLVNRDDPGGRQAFANVSFSDASAAQATAEGAADAAVTEAAAAKDDAIAAAAADATSKADAAEAAAVSTAEGYTDSRTTNIAATQIADGAITTPKLATNAVVAGSISAGAVGAVAISAGAVTADKIKAGAVIAGKLAADAVVATNIKAGEVNAGHLAVDSVTAGAIATGAVTADSVSANAIGAVAISANAIEAEHIATGAVTADSVSANAIGAVAIAAGAVDTGHLAAGSVIAGKIAADAVTADKIKAGAINAGHIAADAITADKIAAGAIGTGALAAGAVVTDKLAAGAVAAGNIAAGAVTADKISADAIDGKTITGATVQTEPSGTLPRIAINGFYGITAQDASGAHVFQVEPDGSLYAESVTLNGDFTTAASGARVNLGAGGWTGDAGTVELYSAYAGEDAPALLYAANGLLALRAPKANGVPGAAEIQMHAEGEKASYPGLGSFTINVEQAGGDVAWRGAAGNSHVYAADGAWYMSISDRGISAPAMRPTYHTGGNFTRAALGERLDIPGAEFTFTVPPSGIVTVTMSAASTAYPGGQCDVDFTLTDSAGTVHYSPPNDALCHNRNTDYVRNGGSRLVTGLPPDEVLTLQPQIYARTQGSGDAGCYEVETIVTPSP